MKAIKQKLHNQRGATLLMAIMLLLVVIMVSYIILNASLSSGTLTAESNPYEGKEYPVTLTVSVKDMTITYDGNPHGYWTEISENMTILYDGVTISPNAVTKYSFGSDETCPNASPETVQNSGESLSAWVKITYANMEATAQYHISITQGALSIQAPANSQIQKTYTDGLIVSGKINAPEGMVVHYKYGSYPDTTTVPTLDEVGELPVWAWAVDPNGNYANSSTVSYTLKISANNSITLHCETQELSWTGSPQSGTFTVDIDNDKGLTIDQLTAKGITVTYTSPKTTVTDLGESATVSFTVSKKNYNSKDGSFTIKIVAAGDLSITAPEGYSDQYDGESHAGGTPTVYLNNTAVNPSANGITVEYSETPNVEGSWTQNQPTIQDQGEKTVYVRAKKTGCETVVSDPYTLKVTPYNCAGKSITVTVTGTSWAGWYDGETHTVEPTIAITKPDDCPLSEKDFTITTLASNGCTNDVIGYDRTVTLSKADVKLSSGSSKNFTNFKNGNIKIASNNQLQLTIKDPFAIAKTNFESAFVVFDRGEYAFTYTPETIDHPSYSRSQKHDYYYDNQSTISNESTSYGPAKGTEYPFVDTDNKPTNEQTVGYGLRSNSTYQSYLNIICALESSAETDKDEDNDGVKEYNHGYTITISDPDEVLGSIDITVSGSAVVTLTTDLWYKTVSLSFSNGTATAPPKYNVTGYVVYSKGTVDATAEDVSPYVPSLPTSLTGTAWYIKRTTDIFSYYDWETRTETRSDYTYTITAEHRWWDGTLQKPSA